MRSNPFVVRIIEIKKLNTRATNCPRTECGGLSRGISAVQGQPRRCDRFIIKVSDSAYSSESIDIACHRALGGRKGRPETFVFRMIAKVRLTISARAYGLIS